MPQRHVIRRQIVELTVADAVTARRLTPAVSDLISSRVTQLLERLFYTAAGPDETRRIDRLDPESQLTLKVASVTGLRFPTPLIVDVHPTARSAPEIIRRHLALHVSIDLLQAEAVEEMEG